jgi:hypothetical protein
MHDATDPRPPHSIIPEAITAPILVGYNGSTSSRHALAYAAGMARRMARPLMLAHVQPAPGRYAIAGNSPSWPAKFTPTRSSSVRPSAGCTASLDQCRCG